MFNGTVNFERRLPSPRDKYGFEKLSQRIADCLREAIGLIALQLEKTSFNAMTPADRAAALIVEAILRGAPTLWNLIEAQKAEIMISRDVTGISVEVGWPEESHPMKMGPLASAQSR